MIAWIAWVTSRPRRVDYSLTAFGETLRPIMDLLNEWGQNDRKRIAKR
jgi:DNA-binding HxlR family transcriptional regulator